jgi:hypothetical protein
LNPIELNEIQHFYPFLPLKSAKLTILLGGHQLPWRSSRLRQELVQGTTS